MNAGRKTKAEQLEELQRFALILVAPPPVEPSTGIPANLPLSSTLDAVAAEALADRGVEPEPVELVARAVDVFGDTARALLDGRRADARSHALRTAALLVRIAEELGA